jgi:ABC-type multidrug transport system ATPase subunit
MTTERSLSSRATPVLVLRTHGSDQRLRAGQSYTVGRDPDCDIVVADSRVSWRHAVVRFEHGTWIFEDAGSTNGTFLGNRRVGRCEISSDCVLRLGHPDDGPVVLFSLTWPEGDGAAAGEAGPTGLSVDRRPTAVHRAPVRVLRIGRLPDNDLVLADLGVSRHHAELRNLGAGRYEITDLGSHNGTYVNGERIATATITEHDIIGIGRATFRIVGDELREFIDEGDVSLVAQDLTVRLPGGKVLLDHVSFPIGERSLVAIIGPSGAGKTTLLGALTGMRPAGEGAVLYDNRDLYKHYAELRHRIGLVPQENILHTQLSARRALRYAAELRFPRDTSKKERNDRVEEVIDELSLKAHAETRAASLSGGQQKRVNVALELLTKPSLLFLDEPTSGLDPGLDKSVMEMMSGLAKDGRTVIVVTHSVANLDVCDRLLVMVPGGRVAFFGPPAEGLKHFGKPGWAEVFQAFDSEPDRDWAAEWKQSPLYVKYVASGLTSRAAAPSRRQAPPPPKSRNRAAQLSTLIRRYISVIASDRVYLAFLAGVPIVLGLVIRVIPAKLGLGGKPGTNDAAEQLLQVLVLCACFAGAFIAVRELVKERAIFSRERAAGLSAGAYLSSKVVVLGVISAVQAGLLLLIGLSGQPLPAHGAVLKGFPLAELLLAICALAVVSMALGLLISASVNTSEKAMPLLLVAVVVEIIFTGTVFALNGKAGLEQVAWLSPSRWGFAAPASTADLTHIMPPVPGAKPDPLWLHTASTWLKDMAGLAILAVLFTLLTWWRLVRLSPGRRR